MVFEIDILRKIRKRMCHGIRGQFYFPESTYLFKKMRSLIITIIEKYRKINVLRNKKVLK